MTYYQDPPQPPQAIWGLWVFLSLAFLLLSGGAILWILNSTGVIAGPWAAIFPVVFAVLGIIVPLILWFFRAPSRPGSESSPLPLPQRSLAAFRKRLSVSTSKGGLLLLIDNSFQGAPVHLSHGFDRMEGDPDLATAIVGWKLEHLLMGVGLLAALDPGNYTLLLPGEGWQIDVSIQAGQLAVVDWRTRCRKRRSGR